MRAATSKRLADFALEQRHDAAEEDASEALDSVSFSTSTIFAKSAGITESAIRNSRNEFKRIGIKLAPADEPDLSKLKNAWRAAAAERAEKILARERDTIVELLSDSEDRTPDELQDRIDERLVVTKSKLDRAAHDDVLTLNGRLTQERQTAAGVTKFIWTTTGNERVRPTHAEIDGQTFDWDDPPVTNDDGDTNIPGGDYNCHCVPFPVLDELDGADDEATDDADEENAA